MTTRDTEAAGKRALGAEERGELLRAGWYDHDARWHAAVADPIGLDVANYLDARASRAQGKAEVQRAKAGRDGDRGG